MMDIIRSYGAYTKIYFYHFSKHKLNLIGKMFYIPVNIFILSIVWVTLSYANPSIDLSYVLPYYICGSILAAAFPFARYAREIQEEILYYKTVAHLLRPGGYLTAKLAYCTSWCMVYLMMALPLCIGTLVFFQYPLTGKMIFLYILFAFAGNMISIFMWTIIGVLSYWTGKNLGIIKVNYTLSLLLSASLIPYDLLPKFVQQVFSYFPYKYTFYYPMNVLYRMGNGNIHLLQELCLILFWMVFLWGMLLFLSHQGERQYE